MIIGGNKRGKKDREAITNFIHGKTNQKANSTVVMQVISTNKTKKKAKLLVYSMSR